MRIIAFQDVVPEPPPVGELLERAREGIEEGVTTAARESAGFIIDLGAVLASVAWLAFVVLAIVLAGRRVRSWSTRRAIERWPDRPNRATLIDQVLQIAFVVIAFLFGLRTLGIYPDSLVTAIGIIVAALSIALQDVLKNLVAGVYLLVEQPFRDGDRLSIPGVGGNPDGWVEKVSMRVTQLRNPQRELMLIPNYILFSSIVVNRTEREPYSLALRLSFVDSPAREIEGEIQAVLAPILGNRVTPPSISLTGAGPLGTAAEVRVWFPPDQELRHTVIVAMNERFPEAFLEVISG
ncbi:MAG: mechanosensitive ion channel family protein [Thermomicrobiales bacterium]